MKVNEFQSKVCLLLVASKDTFWSCGTFNTLYQGSGGTQALPFVLGSRGFMGIIRKLKVFNYSKVVRHEAMHNVRVGSRACTSGNCSICDIESRLNSTDFRYKCYPTCRVGEWLN